MLLVMVMVDPVEASYPIDDHSGVTDGQVERVSRSVCADSAEANHAGWLAIGSREVKQAV